MDKMHPSLKPFRQSLEMLDRVGAENIFNQTLAYLTPIEAVEQLVIPALVEIGEAWQTGQVALSQVYMCGRFCEKLVETVLPASDPDRKHQPRSAIVVLSDYHMLGKRIVYSIMRASGYELFDYGRMEVAELVERVIADNIHVLLVSVLILPSALKVADVCKALKDANVPVKVLVGGAPFLFDDVLWREVGADAMGRNAAEAITIIEKWMREMS